MVYWPAFVILLLLLLVIYILVKAIRVARLSPAERQEKIHELQVEQAKLKAERCILNSNNSEFGSSIRYETNDEDPLTHSSLDNLGQKGNSLQEFENILTTMWAGDTKPVEFTYVDRNGDKTRRKVKVNEVSFNTKGQFYLHGVCLTRNERRTFKLDNIGTKFKVGSSHYDFEEWCVYMLDILPSEGFPREYFD